MLCFVTVYPSIENKGWDFGDINARIRFDLERRMKNQISMRGSKNKKDSKEKGPHRRGGQGFGLGRLDYQKPGGGEPLH